jgi:hypothetical protein
MADEESRVDFPGRYFLIPGGGGGWATRLGASCPASDQPGPPGALGSLPRMASPPIALEQSYRENVSVAMNRYHSTHFTDVKQLQAGKTPVSTRHVPRAGEIVSFVWHWFRSKSAKHRELG